MEYTFLDCKQYAGGRMNVLMSTSDRLGPFIFCRRMQKARPMREEMDEKEVYFPPESAFSNFDGMIYKVVFTFCTLTWRAKKYVSRRGEV